MENKLKRLHQPISLVASAAVGGKKEGEGPFGKNFDYIDPSGSFGKEKWEQSEAEAQALALNFALHKAKWKPEDLGAMMAGDLINQCTSSGYGLLQFDAPFLGIFGACSTSAEGLLLSALLLDSGHFEKISVVSSSHFCSAERQFRSPVEYGGQRPPTAQWTVTGAGAFLLERECGGKVLINEVLPGTVRNAGIDDPNNMGAAMAPAALDTLLAYFRESGKKPSDFDLVLTGDLGNEGSKILLELGMESGLNLEGRHNDCGLMIYDRNTQDIHSGGSGCGCAATVLSSFILPEMEKKSLKDILFVATGALLSADSVKQGLTIPAVAHLVHLTGNNA